MQRSHVAFAMFASFFLFVVLGIGATLHACLDYGFYEQQFMQNGAFDRFGHEAFEAGKNIIGFLKGDAPLSGFFNQKEKAHMADVKNLFDISIVVECFVVFILFGLLATANRKWPAFFTRIISLTLIASLVWAGLFLFLGLGAMSDFGQFWTGFHTKMFSNDLWQLNPQTDNMILLFPESFFVALMRRIFRDVVLLSVLLAFMGTVMLMFKRR